MNKTHKTFILSLLILFALSFPLIAGAVPGDGLTKMFSIYDSFAGQAGLPGFSSLEEAKNQPQYIVATIISSAMTFLGVLFLVLSVYGGFRWMLARGNEEEAKKAKTIIKDAVIGIAIVLSSYVITMGVTYYLTRATSTG